MASRSTSGLSGTARARGLGAAGIAIILLSAGAAMVPAGKALSADIIGALLIAAGLIEAVAGTLRREARPFAVAAGVVTALAGLLFEINPQTHFFPTVLPIVGWLLVRSLILIVGSRESSGSVRTWTALSAGMDFLLAVLTIAGLSISTIVISIFGPTEELVADFAWVLAASFVVTGLLQLEVASCERAAVQQG
jgi:uncharacterized membrane protein